MRFPNHANFAKSEPKAMSTATLEPKATDAPSSEWISRKETCRILGADTYQIKRIVTARLLTMRRLPLAMPQFLRADVERMARESIKPAVSRD